MVLKYSIDKKLDRYFPAFYKVKFEEILTDLADQVDNVSAGVLAPGSVSTAEIADEAVTVGKMADLAIGSILIGTTDNRPVALDAKGDGKILIGNGTTAAMQTVSGDVTITNAGVTAIGSGAIDLAMLSAGITPDRIAKYVGHLSWSGSGASLAVSQPGVLSTDYVIATIESAPSQAAYLVSAKATTDTITIVLSAANTSDDAVINYVVMRAAA